MTSGANPLVRRCTFSECRDTGIFVRRQGLGRFEDCTIDAARNVAVYSADGGSPSVVGCRILSGNVGIAVVNGRGVFQRCAVRDMTGVALRVLNGGSGQFAEIEIENCQIGLGVRGDGGTTAELTDVHVRGHRQLGAMAAGSSRATLRGCSATGGPLGFGVRDEAHLWTEGCQVMDATVGGVIADGSGTFTANGLLVARTEVGLIAKSAAFLDVQGSSIADANSFGFLVAESAGGLVQDCEITGTRGVAIQHNGRALLTDLRTTLPVTKGPAEETEVTVREITNIFEGPAFLGPVTGTQHRHPTSSGERMPNDDADQTVGQDEPPARDYHIGPTIHGPVYNPNMFWNNEEVVQNQVNIHSVAAGFEDVAAVVGEVLRRLGDLGLPAADAREATENANAVLAEVQREEPDRGIVQRGLTALKGTLAQLAAGLLTGTRQGAVELAKEFVRALGQLVV